MHILCTTASVDIQTSRLSGNDMNCLFRVFLLGRELETVKYTGGFMMVRVQYVEWLVRIVTRKTTQLRSICRQITETLVRQLVGGARHVGTFSITPHSICDSVTASNTVRRMFVAPDRHTHFAALSRTRLLLLLLPLHTYGCFSRH
jgi:hypothetical protein